MTKRIHAVTVISGAPERRADCILEYTLDLFSKEEHPPKREDIHQILVPEADAVLILHPDTRYEPIRELDCPELIVEPPWLYDWRLAYAFREKIKYRADQSRKNGSLTCLILPQIAPLEDLHHDDCKLIAMRETEIIASWGMFRQYYSGYILPDGEIELV